jgi:OHCU decarboxylase
MARVASARPFRSADAVFAAADAANAAVTPDGWLEAFRHHPRIGERSAERSQSEAARQSSSREQASAGDASAGDAAALAKANRDYELKFGHIFVICASGRTAAEMIAALQERMRNDPRTELAVAAGEQKKITRLRLERLLK